MTELSSSAAFWQQQFLPAWRECRKNRHRLPLIVFDSQFSSFNKNIEQHHELIHQWVTDFIKGFPATLSVFLIGESITQPNEQITVQSIDKPLQVLGCEFDLVIYDARKGLNANWLAAVSGTVKAGGVFVLIVPEANSWLALPCKEQVRLYGSELKHTSFFYQRCLTHINLSTQVLKFHFRGKGEAWAFNAEIDDTEVDEKESSSVNDWLDFEQQQNAISAVKKVISGHPKRPLVLTADRGRGKSSALGKALAELVNESEGSFVITSYNQQAIHSVLQWFHQFVKPELKNKLQFFSPDQCVHKLKQNQLSNIQGIFVDEAAAIPAPMLKHILLGHSRVVFATTIGGYEGTGRGFEIRFMSQLEKLRPQYQRLQLTQPIRFNPNDPLEQWVADTLLLNENLSQSKSTAKPEKNDVFVLNNEVLFIKPGQQVPEDYLNQSFHLLVNAHYQTSPDDLRQLMEHPDRFLLLLLNQSQVIGVALVLQETGLSEDWVHPVMAGKRRLRGKLTLQTLAYNLQQQELAQRNCWRIQRIAVLPEYRRHKLGSYLISAVKQQALSHSIAFLSTSFAASEDVLSFWLAAQFKPIRMGITRDKVSGCHSVLMVYNLMESDRFLWSRLQQYVSEQTIKLLSSSLQDLEPELLLILLNAIKLGQGNSLSNSELAKLQRFANDHLSWQDIVLEVEKLLLVGLKKKNKMDKQLQALMVLAVHFWQLQDLNCTAKRLDLAGKKEALQMLRDAMSCLL